MTFNLAELSTGQLLIKLNSIKDDGCSIKVTALLEYLNSYFYT